MTEQQQVLRGQEAAQLLENDLLCEIWGGMEKEAIEALVSCSMKPDAKEDRDALIWHLKMVHKQKAIFFGMIEQGRFAQYKIDSKKENSTIKNIYRRVAGG